MRSEGQPRVFLDTQALASLPINPGEGRCSQEPWPLAGWNGYFWVAPAGGVVTFLPSGKSNRSMSDWCRRGPMPVPWPQGGWDLKCLKNQARGSRALDSQNCEMAPVANPADCPLSLKGSCGL